MSELTERISSEIRKHQPSRWRSWANENTILRCCGTDFGNATKKAKRGDDERAWGAYADHLAGVLEGVCDE